MKECGDDTLTEEDDEDADENGDEDAVGGGRRCCGVGMQLDVDEQGEASAVALSDIRV